MKTEKIHLVSIVQKPAQEVQIQAMLEAYQPDCVTLLVQTDSGRIDEDSILQWDCIARFSGALNIQPINFFAVTMKNLRQRLDALRPFSYVALPLYVGLPYWGNVRWLRQFSTVINLADGSAENTSIRDCFLRIKVKDSNLFQTLKGLLLPPLIKRGYLADICFYPFAPAYNSCFAAVSHSAGVAPLSRRKQAVIESLVNKYNPRCLIVGGFEHTPESLAKAFQIQSYIATTKGKAIWVNGIEKSIEEFICAEDILSVFKPQLVIGSTSDAVVAARVRYPDVLCYALESVGAANHWGSRFNEIYRKQTQKVGVKVLPAHGPDKDYAMVTISTLMKQNNG